MQLTPEMTYRETIAGPWGLTAGSPLGDRVCWEVPAATVTGPRIEPHPPCRLTGWYARGRSRIT